MNILSTARVIAACLSLVFVVSCATIAGVDEPTVGPEHKYAAATFPYDKYSEGRPDLNIRIEGGVYIWRVGNSWSVRIAKKVDRPRATSPFGPIFTGSVLVEQAVLFETRKYQISSFSEVLSRQKEISFKIDQREMGGNEVEGFDFKVRPTAPDYCITFDIMVDGSMRPDMIRLGSFMHQPDQLPLTICLRGRN
jgi:hypothetical protein